MTLFPSPLFSPSSANLSNCVGGGDPGFWSFHVNAQKYISPSFLPLLASQHGHAGPCPFLLMGERGQTWGVIHSRSNTSGGEAKRSPVNNCRRISCTCGVRLHAALLGPPCADSQPVVLMCCVKSDTRALQTLQAPLSAVVGDDTPACRVGCELRAAALLSLGVPGSWRPVGRGSGRGASRVAC